MSEKVPVRFLVAAFKDDISAEESLDQMKQLKRQKAVDFQAAAVIRRDREGSIHVDEAGDLGGGEGAGIGAILGGVIGLIGGPAGVVAGAGAGALVGGLTARIYDAGISNKRLKEIGDALLPRTSAVVVILEEAEVEMARKEMIDQGAEVFVESLAAEIAEHLAAGKDVSYSGTVTDDGVIFSEVATSEEENEEGEPD
jgi:uncharacterized membrane protein